MISHPEPKAALRILDVQRDFLPGGALAVPRGDDVVPVLDRCIEFARSKGVPVFAGRDWHPERASELTGEFSHCRPSPLP